MGLTIQPLVGEEGQHELHIISIDTYDGLGLGYVWYDKELFWCYQPYDSKISSNHATFIDALIGILDETDIVDGLKCYRFYSTVDPTN